MHTRVCVCDKKYKNTKAFLLALRTKMQSDNKQFKIKAWKETIAHQCRWSEYAEELVGDWSVLWEDSEADWQGHARVLVFKQGALRYLDWSYGSCSGCDSYEDMGEDFVRNDFKKNVMMHFENINIFCDWLKMLKSTNDDKFEQFYYAISASFKNPEINWIEDSEKLQAKINMLSLLKD